jgi:hypothetical protein
MEYEYLVDPSNLVIESELLALEAKLAQSQERLAAEGYDERILLSIPEEFHEFLSNSEEPIEHSPYARFFANEDDRIASREQILEFLDNQRWDVEYEYTEDKPFEENGYHARIAAVLDNLLGAVENRGSLLIAARRKTLDAFTRAKRTVVHQGKELAEQVVADALQLTEEEREADVLTSANVARTVAKYVILAGTTAGSAYIAASTYPPATIGAGAGGAEVAKRVIVAIDP